MQYKIQPWKHQLDAIERAKDAPYFALFMEMGTGKTATTINILRHKFNTARAVLRTLIFCPPIVIQNWREEWIRHSSIHPKSVITLTGSGKHRLKVFRERSVEPAVFITNYEALLMGDLFEAFQAWRPEVIVGDELHRVKEPKAKRSKAMALLANPWDNAAKRALPKPFTCGLTGTPILNSAMDLFQQFLILDGGKTFGENFFAFRARYFRDRNAGMPKGRYFPDWQILPGALDEMNRRISEVSIRVEKKDCMDLPPLVSQTIRVGMSPEQGRMYEEMKRDFITFVESEAGQAPVAATMAMTKALRLLQITAGYVKTVDGSEVALEDTPKIQALRELLTDITPAHKVLVWCTWKHNYASVRNLCTELGVESVELHGEVSATQREEAISRFRQDPKVRVFIGNPQAAGIGVNLVEASYMIFYSRTFSLEQSLQAEARAHRGGSEIHEKITRIDLVCGNTIDELVLKSLANKFEIGDKVLRGRLVLDLKDQTT